MLKGPLRLLTISFFFFILTPNALAQTLPENHSVNGGVTIVPINIKQKPEAYYNNKQITVIKSPNPNQWLLIVGIPLDKKDEIQQIQLKKPIKASVPFHVSEKFYRTQSLTIKNKRKVDPYAKDRGRINHEKNKMKSYFAKRTEGNPFKKKYIAPSNGPISSLFGLKRVYNNKPRDPHSGLDIAAPEGTPVRAVTDGTVIDADDYFFTGNTVIVDHGQGVFSLYAHLKEMKVKPGKRLEQGEILGTIGKTGRVTGPHLHWMMVMNETIVDPLLFVPPRIIRKVAKKPKKEVQKQSAESGKTN